MHELNDADLLGLIVEETGDAHDSQTVRLTFSCIKHLKAFANFKNSDDDNNLSKLKPEEPPQIEGPKPQHKNAEKSFGLNLGYTINLNLPATADPEVFDAIFKSIKQHLLSDEDA